MSTQLRIATFNLENLDDKAEDRPPLAVRIALMQPQLRRIDADVLCLQEVHGQEEVVGSKTVRSLSALAKLLKGTQYEQYHLVHTATKASKGKEPFDVRNLVVLSRFPVLAREQYMHHFAKPPTYGMVTAGADSKPKEIGWERPIFYAKLQLPDGRALHVINLHLKSKRPVDIAAQKEDNYTWKSAGGWAEGSFLSTIKRVGQALEVRMLVDTLFDVEPEALITVCGDFNADVGEVTLQGIMGEVEETGNANLATRVLVPCERTIPESARYSLYHHGKGNMLDHVLVSRALLAYYRGAEIHNEVLHDESIAFATDVKHPESDHAPVIAAFALPD
jgi:endonuclease/exonuclease/phosphatase family metal-dependent hydrolase